VHLVSIADISDAAERIRHAVVRTPLLPCPWADPSRPLWLKPENLQPIGAFKLRGATNAVARLDDSARKRGVVTYSSGNHAQAVAYAARAVGIQAHIVMPDVTPQIKIDRTREYGAQVVLVPIAERESAAEEIVEKTGRVLVPPFDHPDVIAGQGTAGLEIGSDLPNVELVLIPVSGGGLAAGIGTAIRALCPNATVFGVEPELAADAREGLLAGTLADWPIERRARTIADGLRSQPSELTFAHLRAVLDGIVTVSEEEIRSGMAVLVHKGRLVAEPSGAVALAAYLDHADELPAGRTVVVVSGGNVDPALLADVLGERDAGVPQ
jgi:threonine dehydratase